MSLSTPPEQAGETDAPRRSRRWLRIAGFAVLMLIGLGLVCWFTPLRDVLARAAVGLFSNGENGPDRAEHEAALAARQAQPTAARPADEQYRRLIVGDWHQTSDQAQRDLTLRPDGTGSMLVRPLTATWYLGEQIECDVEWTVENGRAIFGTPSGRPQEKFDRLIGLFGKDRNRKIVELTAERILMYDEQQEKFSEWKRVAADATPPPAEAPAPPRS